MNKKIKILTSILTTTTLSSAAILISCSTTNKSAESVELKEKLLSIKNTPLIEETFEPKLSIEENLDPFYNEEELEEKEEVITPKQETPLLKVATPRSFLSSTFSLTPSLSGKYTKIFGGVFGAALASIGIGLGIYFEEYHPTTKHAIKTTLLALGFEVAKRIVFKKPPTNTIDETKRLLWDIFDHSDRNAHSPLSLIKRKLWGVLSTFNFWGLLTGNTVKSIADLVKTFNGKNIIETYSKDNPDNLLAALFKLFEENGNFTKSLLNFVWKLKDSKFRYKNTQQHNGLFEKNPKKEEEKKEEKKAKARLKRSAPETPESKSYKSSFDLYGLFNKFTNLDTLKNLGVNVNNLPSLLSGLLGEENRKKVTEIAKKVLEGQSLNSEQIKNDIKQIVDGSEGTKLIKDVLDGKITSITDIANKLLDKTDLGSILGIATLLNGNETNSKKNPTITVLIDGIASLKTGIKKLKNNDDSKLREKVEWASEFFGNIFDKHSKGLLESRKIGTSLFKYLYDETPQSSTQSTSGTQ